MWFLTYFTAVCIALLIACAACLGIIALIGMAGDRRHAPATQFCHLCDTGAGPCNCTGFCEKARCPWREVDVDQPLALPIPEHVRQAIAEREGQ